MDDAWNISLAEHDDVLLRSGDFEGDFMFRIFLRCNPDGIEQEFHFYVPADQIKTYTRPQKMQLFNLAVDVVEAFAGTDLHCNTQTRYILVNGAFSPVPAKHDERFTYQIPGRLTA